MIRETNRRSALGIFATAPVAMLPALAVMQCSAPAEAAEPTRFAVALGHHKAMTVKINTMPTASLSLAENERLERDYIDSFHALIDEAPTTPRDFVQKFLVLWDDEGEPADYVVQALLRDAKRFGGL